MHKANRVRTRDIRNRKKKMIGEMQHKIVALTTNNLFAKTKFSRQKFKLSVVYESNTKSFSEYCLESNMLISTRDINKSH